MVIYHKQTYHKSKKHTMKNIILIMSLSYSIIGTSQFNNHSVVLDKNESFIKISHYQMVDTTNLGLLLPTQDEIHLPQKYSKVIVILIDFIWICMLCICNSDMRIL